MPPSASNAYVLGHSHDELDRLIQQGRFFGGLTEELLRTAGLRTGMRVLDIGCGTGEVSFLTAWLVGPTGSVVGVDRSESAVALARQRAASAGLDNVTFMAQDLQTLQLEGGFDAIVGRLVLMYLPDPAATLQRLVQFVRPGGLVAFHEIDIESSTSEPELPLVRLSVQRLAETFRRAHATPRMGLMLPQVFRRAGLGRAQTMLHGRLSDADDQATCAQLAAVTRTLLEPMQRLGVASAAEVDIDTLAERLQAQAAEADATIVAPLLVGAWSRTPN